MGSLHRMTGHTRRLAIAMVTVMGVATLLSACSDGGNSTPPPSSSTVNSTWTPTGALTTARGLHTATRLGNGTVLVVGGGSGTSVVASAELYDPGTGTWSPTGSLTTGRALQTATLLPNGTVLVVGGFTGNSVLASAEVLTFH